MSYRDRIRYRPYPIPYSGPLRLLEVDSHRETFYEQDHNRRLHRRIVRRIRYGSARLDQLGCYRWPDLDVTRTLSTPFQRLISKHVREGRPDKAFAMLIFRRNPTYYGLFRK